ncbi:hypothetical protein GALL_517950 [mine drainage metagenome]|uniref:Uncharacterized protein n=1 Tax=mine drainage metagenome TaxID=410659 RepID=A0A1J5P608_9ZZZZ
MVNTLGSSVARSAVTTHSHAATGSRPRSRIITTSIDEQPPVPISNNSIGDGPGVLPPGSVDDPSTIECPDPDEPTNVRPSTHFTRASTLPSPSNIFRMIVCMKYIRITYDYHMPLFPIYTGIAVVRNTVRSAKDECICATPGNRARC